MIPYCTNFFLSELKTNRGTSKAPIMLKTLSLKPRTWTWTWQ